MTLATISTLEGAGIVAGWLALFFAVRAFLLGGERDQ